MLEAKLFIKQLWFQEEIRAAGYPQALTAHVLD